MSTRIQPLLLASLLSVALGACAGSSGPDDALTPRDAVSVAEPSGEASESTTPAGPASRAVRADAAAAVVDWRPWVESEVDRLRRDRPEHFDAVMGLPARTTRAGLLRLTGPLIRDPDSAPILLHRLLSRGESAEVRAAIVEALPRTTGDYSAALADLMALETEPQVRELIAFSLHRAQAPHAIDGLAMGLADVNAGVRAEALRSLGRRPDGSALAKEIAAALTDADERVAVEAARTLGNLQVATAKEALVAQLSASSAELRRHSLRALSRIDAEYTRALPQLQSLRSDADPKVARVAETIASGG
ncbi:MAG: HEAT repeat domain-containing protein [Myxococcales bacterium]|nr:HEAT repeat domain-containing protein [Myxococcales bacterium]